MVSKRGGGKEPKKTVFQWPFNDRKGRGKKGKVRKRDPGAI